VKSASNPKLGGTVLVDAKGLTLYSLSAEHAGKFICTSAACVHLWHPLTVASGIKPSGKVGSLGVVKRPNGIEQVTYKGMPLYTFAQDSAPGQANGQGFKDVGIWKAVEMSGSAKSSTAAASSSSATPSSGGGGSSYAY
jgi:predicted lipoprotein with Yx(FWY)xxD motif